MHEDRIPDPPVRPHFNPNVREQPVALGFANPPIAGQPSVLVGSIHLSETAMALLGGGALRTLHVFGARVPSPRPGYPDAWCQHFAVAECPGEPGHTAPPQAVHHLWQSNSVAYRNPADADETYGADMPEVNTHLRCVGLRPRWKASEAAIPLLRGELQREGDSLHFTWHDLVLYTFIHQWYVPATATARRLLGGGNTVYLFGARRTDGTLSWQIMCQDMSAQTAEDHYRLEEQLAEYTQHHRNAPRVDALVRQGDQHLHEALLAHRHIHPHTLQSLAQHAKTKALRTQALARLQATTAFASR